MSNHKHRFTSNPSCIDCGKTAAEYITEIKEKLNKELISKEDRISELEVHLGRMLTILESLEGHLGPSGEDDFLPGEQKRIKEANQVLKKGDS